MLDIDSERYAAALAPHAGAPIPDVPVAMSDLLLLLFTSGTSGAPKAVICTQGKLSIVSQTVMRNAGLDRDTVAYQVMPMFHSNALFVGTGPDDRRGRHRACCGASSPPRRRCPTSASTAARS